MRRFLGLRTSEQTVRTRVVGDAVNDEIMRASQSFAVQTEAVRLPHASAPKFSGEEETSLAETAPLLASAIRNEEIRLDYEGLIERFKAFDHLRAEFLGVTQRFVAVVDELEDLKKDKAELQGHLELSEAVGAELRMALTDLEPKYETLVSEKAALEAAGERARETISKIEAAKQKEQEEHQATRDVVKQRDGALAEARAQINALQDEISAGRRELDRLSSTLAEREVAYEQVASALRSSEEQGRMLKTLLDESTFQTARLSRTVSELEPMAERLKSQIATLQAAVEAEREAKEKAAIDRVEGLEVLRAELRATTAKLEAATQRAETQEKMLNTARQNYREKLEELRAVERSVIDLTMQLANMTRRAETAEAEKSALHIRVADLETAERSFDLRYEEVSKALTEKETALLLARDQITFESSRLEEAQRMARLERARYEADMVEMARLLDKERVDRTVLEGALLSNRRRHIQRGTEEEASEAVAETVQETITELVDEESNSSSPALLVDDADSGAVILEFERGPASVTLENTVAADQLSETRSPSAPMAS